MLLISLNPNFIKTIHTSLLPWPLGICVRPGPRRANLGLGMNKHHSKWPGQKAGNFGCKRVRIEVCYFAVSYRKFFQVRQTRQSQFYSKEHFWLSCLYLGIRLFNMHRRNKKILSQNNQDSLLKLRPRT